MTVADPDLSNAINQDIVCRACASPYTVYVQQVFANRTKRHLSQRCCLDCRTFFHTSEYKEDEERKKQDFQFLKDFNSQHQRQMGQLFLQIYNRLPQTRSMCDVGHGAGWMMSAARDFGVAHYGFEVNPYCHEFATKTLHLSCHLGMFDESHSEKYDLITSIMVFEHLEEPRGLFDLMSRRLNVDGAIYICVPFLHRKNWKYLWSARNTPGAAPPDPFYDNDVHITHFSIKGLKRLGRSLGARTAHYFISDDVVHRSPGAYEGVLFQF